MVHRFVDDFEFDNVRRAVYEWLGPVESAGLRERLPFRATTRATRPSADYCIELLHRGVAACRKFAA